jgi:hypothetical protein
MQLLKSCEFQYVVGSVKGTTNGHSLSYIGCHWQGVGPERSSDSLATNLH